MSERLVLVIEDDVGVRALFEATFEMEGWQVATAADGQAGIDAMLARTPDLVILDMMMPGVSGFEVLQAMVGHAELSRVPRIVCTARDAESEVELGKSLGATEWVVKPVRPSQMLEIAERLCS